MKLDHLGHASWIFHGREGAVLFDPLLVGLHHENVYDVYPPRRLDLATMPPVNALILSHGHLDHFDLESIARLPRNLPVFAPPDELVIGCLQGLGFEEITPLTPFLEITIGSLRIYPTPGAVDNELGFLVVEDGTIVWNLVDTFPSEAAILHVRARAPEIHLAIVPWQPLQDTEFVSGRPIKFPFDMYQAILEKTLLIDAHAVVPGACGFVAVGSAAWTNQLLFPVTRERWAHDLVTANPRLSERIVIADPGVSIRVDHRDVERRVDLEYCSSEPYDWRPLAFRPYELGFAMREPDDAFTTEECLGMVRAVFEEEVVRHVETHRLDYEWHFRCAVRQQVEVVFADETRFWLLDFSGPTLRVAEEQSPLAQGWSVVTANTLVRLVLGTCSWDRAIMSGEYRFYHHYYGTDATGLRRHDARRLRDVVRPVLARDSLESVLTGQVEALQALLGSGGEATAPELVVDDGL